MREITGTKDYTSMKHVLMVVEKIGFHEAFSKHSLFTRVRDKEFHSLKNAYLKAYNNLDSYIADVATNGLGLPRKDGVCFYCDSFYNACCCLDNYELESVDDDEFEDNKQEYPTSEDEDED